MKFFTNKMVNNDYLLIKIQDYIKNKEDWSRWKEVLIDPGVYELKRQYYYSWEKDINIKEFLDSLPDNHYFSADYPCDMNPEYTDHFLQCSWDNAIMHAGHPNYIVTVQYKLNDYWSFTEWFDRYNDLYIASGIMGIGNMCLIKEMTEFTKHALGYVFKNCKHPRIHIYGLSMANIPLTYRFANKFNIELSIDSTKWTQACTQQLKDKYPGKWNCSAKNREEFFLEYLKLLKKKGVE